MPKLAGASLPGAVGPVERIGRIADLIEKSSERNETLGQLTPEVVDKLHEQQLFRMLLPRAYDGEEIDLVTWFRARRHYEIISSIFKCLPLNLAGLGKPVGKLFGPRQRG